MDDAFFGFTNCGYVCPTTLTELNKMYQMLQKTAQHNFYKVPYFVDPERDTVGK